jgi:hypothetical protein
MPPLYVDLTVTSLWLLLVATGVADLFSAGIELPIRLTLGLVLAGQIGLHTVYGAETFLYAAHYGPLFLAAVGLATRTRLRPFVIAATVLFLFGLVAHNFRAFDTMLPQLQRAIQLNAAASVVRT